MHIVHTTFKYNNGLAWQLHGQQLVAEAWLRVAAAVRFALSVALVRFPLKMDRKMTRALAFPQFIFFGCGARRVVARTFFDSIVCRLFCGRAGALAI